MELGYWTAAGVLIVHAAIAYADALCIRSAGEKSSGENHEDASSEPEAHQPLAAGQIFTLLYPLFLRQCPNANATKLHKSTICNFTCPDLIGARRNVFYVGGRYSRSPGGALNVH
ncbi:MAG: hypothetical protein Q8P51_15185 [Ignavibacteria bacterium]|nr:hypothetical protein [Ignavibacteria bacterium]